MHVKPLTFCTNKHHTLFRRTCGIQISHIWTQSITRSGLSCKVVSTTTRQKSVAWMDGGWSTSGMALNSRLSTWLLTTVVEDFERASIRKEDHSNTTCELTILILSVCVTFGVTFVWMLSCYIFHSKSMPATPTITPTSVFVLKGAKSVCGSRFYSMLRHRYLLSDMPKKIWKSDSSCQSYSKCYKGHTILTRSFMRRMLWVHLQGSAAK